MNSYVIKKEKFKTILKEAILEKIKNMDFLNVKYYDIANIFTKKIIKSQHPFLTEGIYKTYPIQVVLKHLKEYCHLATTREEYNQNPEKYNGVIWITDLDNGEKGFQGYILNDKISKAMMNKTMALCGYYEATRESATPRLDLVAYEKLNQENKVNQLVKQKKKIYHVTTIGKKDKILKNGLSPKHNDKLGYHPERIYFYLDDNGYAWFREFAKLLYPSEWQSLKKRSNPYFKKANEHFVVFEIDTKNINVDFFFDPNMENAVYTKDNIPSESITTKYLI